MQTRVGRASVRAGTIMPENQVGTRALTVGRQLVVLHGGQ